MELFAEALGWLGYLERSQVAAQVGLIVLIAAGAHLLQQPLLRRRVPRLLRALIGPTVAAVMILILQQHNHASGLMRFLTAAWLGWVLLLFLERGLLRLLPPQRVHELLSRLLRPLYLLAILLLLINRLDSLQDLAVISVGQFFGTPLTLGKLFSSLLVSYLLLIGSGPPAAMVAWMLQKLIGYSDGSRKALELIIRYAVVGVGITAVGFQIGLNTTALVAIAGGLSVGLGFGIKEVFSNFISGIWLLFEGSVRPGEVLMLDGDPCEVRRLGLRATLLWRDRDNAELLIPNQMFFTAQATTYTASDRMRRSEIRIGAAYRHDPRSVIQLLEDTARSVPRVLDHPAPRALQVAYGDSAITYSLRYWIANPMDNIGIISEVNQAIWVAFRRESIEIPFPQQVNTILAPPQPKDRPDAPETTAATPH
ncbi:mechanosensitive ion channel family protein [Synechococcus sp. RS9917]|nr:mechanosensitive ion channel domain-containing protein [Synechococcus sp. RS9917]